jgi:hypothetical protein
MDINEKVTKLLRQDPIARQYLAGNALDYNVEDAVWIRDT